MRNSIELRYAGKVGFGLTRSLADFHSEERCIHLIDGTIWVERLINKERSAVCCAVVIRKHSDAFRGRWEMPETQVEKLCIFFRTLLSGSSQAPVHWGYRCIPLERICAERFWDSHFAEPL